MTRKHNAALGLLALLLSSFSSSPPVWSHSYPAGLQRAQASRAIALLLCDKKNGTISQEEYDHKFNKLPFIHISVDGEIQADHTHLVPDRNKGPEVIAVAREMQKNLDKDCFVINKFVHEKLADKAHDICTLSRQLCTERETRISTLDEAYDKWKQEISPLLYIFLDDEVESSERLSAQKQFCLMLGPLTERMKKKVVLWKELQKYVEDVAAEEDQDFWYQFFAGRYEVFCLQREKNVTKSTS